MRRNRKGEDMSESILAPGAVLALWTLVMLIWAAATRLTALKKVGVDLKAAPPGGRGADLETVLPPSVNWKSHNYTHLVEQPTLFYAVIVFLHLSGGDVGYTRWIRSEEHTSELQSLMRISYAVFC